MLLIVTNKDDPHADFVAQELHSRKITFYRINTEDFPTTYPGTISISNETGFRSSMLLAPGELEFANVGSVWYRRPLPPLIHPGVTDLGFREHASREAVSFLDTLWHTTSSCLWVNHPLSNIAAGEKATQLRLARSLGLAIPETLITNDPEVAREFILSQQKVILKPLKRNRIQRPDGPVKVFYTSVVTAAHLEGIASVALCPHLFQQYIEKDIELRITVIGSRVFAAAIDSQGTNDGQIDWRMTDMDALKHSVFSLPAAVEQKCLQLVHDLGLNFGAIDMIVTKKGEFVFLEVNPNGQWVWIELKTGMPMISAMVDLLVKKEGVLN